MLKIRKEQFDTLLSIAEKKFLLLMIDHVLTEFEPRIQTYGWNNDELESQIKLAISDSRSFGIEYENDIESYIDTMILLGSKFYTSERHTWAKDILLDDTTDGESKMEAIEEYLVFGFGDSHESL